MTPDDQENRLPDIDLRTAHVGFVYADLGGGCFGRRYYWSMPGGETLIWDDELRAEHPELDDREWQRLFADAFDRGETAFVERLVSARPELVESETGRQIVALGRVLGPRPPRDEAPEEA